MVVPSTTKPARTITRDDLRAIDPEVDEAVDHILQAIADSLDEANLRFARRNETDDRIGRWGNKAVREALIQLADRLGVEIVQE